jgi:pyruvate formate lyase activating enzyme
MTKIKLYKQVDEAIKCILCPHFCVLKDGEVGKCHARQNIDGKSEPISVGATSSLAVEPIEKKPFKHFLPGTKTLTWGGWGCNLSCKFCENSKISQKVPFKDAVFKSTVGLVSIAIEKGCSSISMSYNEPTLSYEFLMDLALRCQVEGLDFILKTNAFVNKEPWKEICQLTDAMNIDLKAGTAESFKAVSGCDQYITKDRIKEAYDAGVHIEISLPLYYSDDILEEEIEKMGEFLSSVDKNIPCHLLSIQPSFEYSNFIFNSANMGIAENILKKYMNNIYIVI